MRRTIKHFVLVTIFIAAAFPTALLAQVFGEARSRVRAWERANSTTREDQTPAPDQDFSVPGLPSPGGKRRLR
jgi:hypothetical protein